MLSDDIIEDSWGYQELMARGKQKWLHEGELHALREAVLDIVQDRFPLFVTVVSNHLQNINDTTLLRRLIVKLSDAQTLQEAEQAFRAVVKDAQQH